MVMPDAETDGWTDASLIYRAAKFGDRAAFGQLILRHQGLVRAQLRRLTGGDHAWADDLAQHAFLQAWRKLEEFRGESRFSTWLFRVSYTTFLQESRRRKSATELEFSETSAARDDCELQTLRIDLETALGRLSDGERAALVHCYHLDLSHEETAEILGIPVGTVKSHVARGKAKLRALLSDWNVGRVRSAPRDQRNGPLGGKHD